MALHLTFGGKNIASEFKSLMGLFKLYFLIVLQMHFICQSPLQGLSQVSHENRRCVWSFNQRLGFSNPVFGLDKSRTLAPHPDYYSHLSKTSSLQNCPVYGQNCKTGQWSKIWGTIQPHVPVWTFSLCNTHDVQMIKPSAVTFIAKVKAIWYGTNVITVYRKAS